MYTRMYFKGLGEPDEFKVFSGKADELMRDMRGERTQVVPPLVPPVQAAARRETGERGGVVEGLLVDIGRDVFEMKREMRDVERRMLEVADVTRTQVREEVERGNAAMLAAIKAVLKEQMMEPPYRQKASFQYQQHNQNPPPDRLDDLRIKMLENEIHSLHRELQETRTRLLESKFDYRPNPPPIYSNPDPYGQAFQHPPQPQVKEEENIWKPRYSERNSFRSQREKQRGKSEPSTPGESPIKSEEKPGKKEGSDVSTPGESPIRTGVKKIEVDSPLKAAKDALKEYTGTERKQVDDDEAKSARKNEKIKEKSSESSEGSSEGGGGKEDIRNSTVLSFSAEEFSGPKTSPPSQKVKKEVEVRNQPEPKNPGKAALKNYADSEYGESDSAPPTSGMKAGSIKDSEDEFSYDLPAAPPPPVKAPQEEEFSQFAFGGVSTFAKPKPKPKTKPAAAALRTYSSDFDEDEPPKPPHKDPLFGDEEDSPPAAKPAPKYQDPLGDDDDEFDVIPNMGGGWGGL